jgi:hypothetical protein
VIRAAWAAAVSWSLTIGATEIRSRWTKEPAIDPTVSFCRPCRSDRRWWKDSENEWPRDGRPAVGTRRRDDRPPYGGVGHPRGERQRGYW